MFYIYVDGKPSVKIVVAFGDFHKFNLAYHVGTPITLKGNGGDRAGQLVMNKLVELKSVFGKSKPGQRNG